MISIITSRDGECTEYLTKKYNFILINPKSNSKKIRAETFEFSRDLVFDFLEINKNYVFCFF
jgi:hypothetical protein